MVRSLSTLIAAAVISLAAASAAHAQSPGAPAPGGLHQPSPSTTTEWYGWKILLADTANVATFTALSASGAFDYAPVAPMGAIYLLSGPVIHASRGEVGRALGSLALRGLIPLFGLGVADRMSGPRSRYVLIGLGSMAVATAIDSVVFGRERHAQEAPRSLIEVGGVSANPTLIPTAAGGVTPGLIGTF